MATAYLVPGGNGLINDSTNWSLTSGGVSGYTPSTNDDLVVDINSMNTPLITRTATYNSLTFSDYTGLFTLTQNITLKSGLTYSSGMTTTSTATIAIGDASLTTAFINFNGVTHSGALSFNNGSALLTTYSITGVTNVIGTVNFANGNLSGAGTKIIINGGSILCNSGFGIFGNGNRWVAGTTVIKFVGNGSGNFTSGVSAYFSNMTVIFQKTGGVLNMTTGSLYARNTNITYISGTFTNFILAVNVSNAWVDTNNMVWSSASMGGGTLNLYSQLNVLNTFSNGVAATINGTGGINCNNMTIAANLILPVNSTSNIYGTLTSVGTAASPITISCSGGRANLILSNTGNQDVAHTNGTNIDSDGGTTIYSYRAASISNCDNWATLPIITSINTNSILK